MRIKTKATRTRKTANRQAYERMQQHNPEMAESIFQDIKEGATTNNVYSEILQINSAYARTCLAAAEHLFDNLEK